MPRKITVLMNWSKNPPLDQGTLLKTVGDKVTENASIYPGPPYTNVQLAAIVSDFNTKYANRLNGAYAREVYKVALKDVNAKLHDMADFVSEKAGGSAAMITLVAFTPTDPTPHPAPMPEQPTAKLTAHPGAMIEIRLEHTGHRESYVHVVGENAEPQAEVNGNHITITSAGVVHIITDGHQHEDIQVSPAADKVYVQSLAQNATGKSAFSAVVSTKVLE